ncbi:MAG: tetratricopeptide repeat protein [Planctomycetota bacterium]
MFRIKRVDVTEFPGKEMWGVFQDGRYLGAGTGPQSAWMLLRWHIIQTLDKKDIPAIVAMTRYPATRSREFVVRADAKRALGHLFAALSDYDQAIALNPRDCRARLQLGNLLLEMGESEEAREHLEKVPHLADPVRDHNVLTRYVEHQIEFGKIPEGLNAFETLLAGVEALVSLPRNKENYAIYNIPHGDKSILTEPGRIVPICINMRTAKDLVPRWMQIVSDFRKNGVAVEALQARIAGIELQLDE